MNAQKFLDNFGYIANAPQGVQRLREMIYNLAITGDLSQQRPEDRDGQSLLEQITETRRQLIERKSFKRSPKLENFLDTFATELPNIPGSWVWTRLVDIGEINPKNQVEDDMLASFASMSAIPETYSGEMNPDGKPWGTIKKGFTHFADGDVVLAKITPCFENGKSAVIEQLSNGVGAGTTELHVIRPITPFVNPRFIYIFLRSPYFKTVGETHMTGTAGQRRLPTEYFATRPFPLPPLEEQKRIVAKVAKLMALCEELETSQQKREELCQLTQITTLDALASSRSPYSLVKAWIRVTENFDAFLDSPQSLNSFCNLARHLGARGFLTSRFGDNDQTQDGQLYPLPSGWEWTTIGDLADYVTSGSRGWKQYIAARGDIFIRSQDIKHDALIFEDTAFVYLPEKVEGKRTLVREGDLLITITGANVGKCAVVPQMANEGYVSQHVALIRLKNRKHAPFLHLWVTNSFGGRRLLLSESYGDKPGLNLKQITGLRVPLPPLEEQIEIVNQVEQLVNIFDTLGDIKSKERAQAAHLAKVVVATLAGTQIKEEEKMKAPKTELISKLKIGASPKTKTQAPLTSLLEKNQGELSAKALWNFSGLKIDTFYQQLKTEMANGWIIEPEKALMREVETN